MPLIPVERAIFGLQDEAGEVAFRSQSAQFTYRLRELQAKGKRLAREQGRKFAILICPTHLFCSLSPLPLERYLNTSVWMRGENKHHVLQIISPPPSRERLIEKLRLAHADAFIKLTKIEMRLMRLKAGRLRRERRSAAWRKR